MNRMINIQRLVLLLLFFMIAASNLTLASDLPYTKAGSIDYLYGNEIVIRDSLFTVSSSTNVVSEHGFSITLSDLEVGDNVGYNIVSTGENSWFVTHIWKLSDSFDFDEFYNDD